VINRRVAKIIEKVIFYGLIFLGIIIVLFPIVWMISTSLKDKGAMFAYPPQWIPENPTLESYKIILSPSKNPFLLWFRNSILVGLGTAFASLLLAIPAGYAFSRFRFRARNVLLLFIIASQMFPIVLLLISIYLMYNSWGFINTLHGLVLAYMCFALPFAIWMLKNYFDTIPRELEEAALIDGCGRFSAMIRVALPLIGPAAVSVGTFCFLVAWNELLFAMTLNTSDVSRPLAPGLLIRYAGSYQSSYNEMMAASVLASIPVIIIFITMQRYVVAGLTLGAVKG
jgi:multiple sugar transport system permease protein